MSETDSHPRGRRQAAILLLAALLVSAASAALAGDPTPAAEWERLRADFSPIRSIEADFVQEKHLKILARPLVSAGSFAFRAPGDIRWEYLSPVRSLVVIHGERLRRFLWADGRYEEAGGMQAQAMGLVLDEIKDWLSGHFENSKVFAAELKPGTPARIELTPREEAMKKYIQSATLVLSEQPGVLESIEIREGPDSWTLLRFENIGLNRDLPDSLFTAEAGNGP